MLDPRGNYEGRSPSPPPEIVEAALAARNLDDGPLAARYLTWAGDVVRGDFGATWDGRSVNEELADRIGVSLRLIALGMVLGSVAGVLLGAWLGAGGPGWARLVQDMLDDIGIAVRIEPVGGDELFGDYVLPGN